MKTVHVKSPCCQARAIRFGGKRRQCVKCRKTFRIRPKRRGRRRIRHAKRYIQYVFGRDLLVKHLARGTLALAAVQKRFQQALLAIVSKPRTMHVRGKSLSLIIDGRWHNFKDERWTMYFLTVKPVDRDEAVIFDPELRPGKESAATWSNIIETTIPPLMKNRIVALVSDGIAGGKGLARQFGWQQQRCHFHLLKELEKRRGKRKRLFGWTVREAIYQTVRQLLVCRIQTRKKLFVCRLQRLSERKECPKKVRMIVNDLLNNLPEFHLYLTHPEWNLPNTTGVMESLNSAIHAGVRKVRTPAGLLKWATAIIRSHSKFVCKRTNYQPN